MDAYFYKIKRYFASRLQYTRNLLSRVIQLALPLWQRLPITSQFIVRPYNYQIQTSTWVAQSHQRSKHYSAGYIHLTREHRIMRKAPGTLDDHPHWKFDARTHDAPATFVAVVPGGKVVGGNGAVVTSDNQLLFDVSKEFGVKEPEQHSLFRRWRASRLRYFETSVAVVATAGHQNYFHWMFDALPRIDLIQKSTLQPELFVCNYQSSFQFESLQRLGITAQQIIDSNYDLHVQAQQLIVPSLPGRTGNMTKQSCDFLRKTFLTEQSGTNERPLRLYISRTEAPSRRILNEDSVLAQLAYHNFQVIKPEHLSIAEQALLFSSAEIVIAPHGAGLTNLVFCSPGTTVIEFFSPRYVNVCYWALSNLLDLQYYYLLGIGEIPPEYYDPHDVGCDIIVNVNQLNELLEKAVSG